MNANSKPRGKRNAQLTGAAGAYYVGSRLALAGFNAALTVGNAPGVDILVSLPEGDSTVAVQVKTSSSALRMRGRGEEKAPHHYEWPVGKKAALANKPDLFFALVDLKDSEQHGRISALPDVFIVRSTQIHDYFQNLLRREGKSELAMWSYWPLVSDIEPYRDRWDILESYLHGDPES